MSLECGETRFPLGAVGASALIPRRIRCLERSLFHRSWERVRGGERRKQIRIFHRFSTAGAGPQMPQMTGVTASAIEAAAANLDAFLDLPRRHATLLLQTAVDRLTKPPI